MLWIFFGGFVVFILILIALDLGVIGRQAHVIHLREALLRTAGWIAIALSFNVLVYFMYKYHWLGIGQHMRDPDGNVITIGGWRAAVDFFTGYLLEQSLSVDNMFVIATIFSYFQVPLKQQHRVLFWGIIGALVLRGIMIALGVALISRFEWMTYVFGGLLLITAAKMALSRSEEIHPDRNLVVRLVRSMYPVVTTTQGNAFFVPHQNKKGKSRRAVTPLFLALILVETSDIMFAVDSIPAIFVITRDPFIIFTSNVFAICGLRSLYFALAGLMEKFRYLKASLVFVLAYIGLKMILTHFVEIPTWITLIIVVAALAVGVTASLIVDRREHDEKSEEA